MSELPFEHLDWVDELWGLQPSGLRLEAIREGARGIREALQASGKVLAVRTLPLFDVPYPRSYAFWHAEGMPYPYVLMRHRMVLVQFLSGGQLRTLLFNPTEFASLQGLRVSAAWRRRRSAWMLEHLIKRFPSPLEQVRALGLRPEQVDFLTFGHLFGQDLRPVVGTDGRFGVPLLEPRYPNALLLAQEAELSSLRNPHPLQQRWVVTGAVEGILRDRVRTLKGSYLLGQGVALLHTPGHTAGTMILVLNTPRGIEVVTPNATTPDAYAPQHSKIPGLRRAATRQGSEFILHGNLVEMAMDQYSAMALEKAVAEVCPRKDAFVMTHPTSLILSSFLTPGVRPYVIPELSFGELVRSRQLDGALSRPVGVPLPSPA